MPNRPDPRKEEHILDGVLEEEAARRALVISQETSQTTSNTATLDLKKDEIPKTRRRINALNFEQTKSEHPLDPFCVPLNQR